MNLLLIDHSHFLYKNVFTHQHLNFAGQFTGGSYGYLMSLAKILNAYPKHKIVICKDSPPYRREVDNPKYKGDRSKHEPQTNKMINDSVRQIDNILYAIGLTPLKYVGLEADDIIGLIVQQYPENKIVIASSDSDLHQLLKPNITMNKSGEPYTLEDFKREFPTLQPQHWPIVVALSGSHNGISGIKGIGVKTAYKLLIQGADSIQARIGIEQMEILSRNIELATIPYPKIQQKVELPAREKYNERELILELSSLGITLTGTMQNIFTSDTL